MPKTNFLLVGPVGTGKTHSLRTIAASGHNLYVLATEPGVEKILTHSIHTPGSVHWNYVPPATPDWDTLQQNAKMVNTMTQEQLMRQPGINRQNYRQFIAILEALSNFTCSVCGKSFGPVDKFGPEDVLAIDGLSGISTMSMDLVAGGKPTKSQADWGTAMDNIERLLAKLTGDTRCSFVLISHVDRELDEITGGSRVMASTLGRKLAPKVPRFFDEVVLAHRQGSKFLWSTTDNSTDLKCRRLPFSDQITPDFEPLLAGAADA